MIKRREKFWDNPERLRQEIDDKLSKVAAKERKKRDKEKKQAMERAAKRAEEMAKVSNTHEF